MKRNTELIRELLSRVDGVRHIRSDSIPSIDLYMDQVTSFMEEKLKATKRYPQDKVLTKTMINNYAKNDLLPAPVKKKYSREHMIMLLFIYYYKSFLSFRDIGQLFGKLTDRHFQSTDGLNLEGIYNEVFRMEPATVEQLKEDVEKKLEVSEKTFLDADPKEREYLRLFALISELSFDVYMKTKMIENLIDQLRAEDAQHEALRRKRQAERK